MEFKSLLVIFMFCILNSLEAQYPIIRDAHPRIYADHARIESIKEKIKLPGEAQDLYDGINYAYLNWWINDPQLYVVGEDSTLWTWDWNYYWARDQVFLNVFLYKMSADPLELKRIRFIIDNFIQTVNGTNWADMDWYIKEDLLRTMSDAGGILLDWCHDDLTIVQRDAMEQSMYRLTTEFMNTYIYSSAGTSYVSSHNTWNNIFCNQNSLVLYNATGLTVEQRDTVGQWFRDVYDKLQYGFIPCWSYYRDDDGGWNWGAAYAMWSLVDQFQLFENMRIATDKNFFQDLPWIKESINQYIYFMQPNNQCIHLGDGEMSLEADRVMFLHARYYDDDRSKWMAQKYSQTERLGNTMVRYTCLLYKDFDQPPVNHHNAPLQWYSDKVGLAVSFSDWDTSATMVTFFNSPSKRAAHEHRDNNSFTIFKKKPLLIDAGYYDTYNGEHYRNYYQRTIAHNVICVYDSTEVMTSFGRQASNDGGQIDNEPLQNYDDIFAPESQRGEWIAHAANSEYTLNVADAQLSYDSSKLDFFRRRLLFLPPNKTIVLDHVHLKHSDSRQRDIQWTAHFVNRPIINGNILDESVAGHIISYDGREYSAANGSGNVAVKTLLPAQSNTTLIGGKDYEYWVNGKNYPPLTLPDSVYHTSGNWRIEVRPDVVQDAVIFLHTISVGDEKSTAVAGGQLLQSTASIGVDWVDTLCLFAADGGREKTYQELNQVSGGRNLRLIANDMKAGGYKVLIDDVIYSSGTADENGILTSDITLTSGLHKIVITNQSIAINATTGIPFKVYPNPAKDEVFITFDQLINEGRIQLINVYGQTVRSINLHRQSDYRMNLQVSPGIYFLRITTEHGKIFGYKLIKE